MSLLNKAVVVLALLASDCQAVGKSHSKRMKHDIISSTMRDIASREPQIAVLQNKLNKMQTIKPRLDTAKHDIDEMLRDPQPQEDESVKELARRALAKMHREQEDSVPVMARKALDKLYGSEKEDDSVPALAKKALHKINGGSSPSADAEGDDIASLAKKALKNIDKISPDEKAELQDLAKKALKNLEGGSAAASGGSVQAEAKKALDGIELKENAQKALDGIEIQELAKKAMANADNVSKNDPEIQKLAKRALKNVDEGGDDIKTLAKKALNRIENGDAGGELQTLAKAALKNIAGSLVQTNGDDGILFKGDLKQLDYLNGDGLKSFIKQTSNYARDALDDVEYASRQKAQKYMEDA